MAHVTGRSLGSYSSAGARVVSTDLARVRPRVGGRMLAPLRVERSFDLPWPPPDGTSRMR